MPHALGALIEAEVGRAEADMVGARNRGQAVLTASGALVTLLAGVLALAVGNDAKLVLTGLTAGAAITALIAFVGATIFVLIMYLPSPVLAASDDDLATFAHQRWDDVGWEQRASEVLTTYLRTLRAANRRLAILLVLSIAAEVIGIASVAVLAVSLLDQAA